LCTECANGLVLDELCPEQFTARATSPMVDAANAWLIDGYGIPHTITLRPPITTATIGRARTCDVCIADRTISQAHASLEYRQRSNAWFAVDSGGDNGVFVNDDRVTHKFPLEPRDRVFLGRRVGFVFMPLDPDVIDEALRELHWLRASELNEPTMGDAGVDDDVPLQIAAVTEGGAIARFKSERVQLSELEYELLVVLEKAWREQENVDAVARGFVPASRLLETLSFVSEAPTHANLRGLVRKLRKKLVELDVIESRQGLGYRIARPVTLT